jgi:hypothetical protein
MNCRLCPGALCLRVVFDFGSFRVRGSRRADGGSARGRMAAPEPPAEHEAAYYAQPQPQPVARPTTEASTKPGAVQLDTCRDGWPTSVKRGHCAGAFLAAISRATRGRRLKLGLLRNRRKAALVLARAGVAGDRVAVRRQGLDGRGAPQAAGQLPQLLGLLLRKGYAPTAWCSASDRRRRPRVLSRRGRQGDRCAGS